ncbi:MAG: YifB family Mg chelatase-like AAA ATPase [Lapillicoccus sp.]
MSLGRTLSVGLTGIVGFRVEVEVDVSSGLPAFTIGGCPDSACGQAPGRVKAAAANSGFAIPLRRVTVNLSPASVPKVGSGFDLAICVAALVACEEIRPELVRDVVHIGELGLDGSVRPLPGVLPLVLAAVRGGARHVVVPVANAAEARLVAGARVHPVAHLAELVARYRLLHQGLTPAEVEEPLLPVPERPAQPDLVDVVGQAEARHALEVAAAGGHHVYLVGPPGSGKTMLAERLPGLLPALDDEQAMEVTAIASIMGRVGRRPVLERRPPFIAPHHGASAVALVGGGSGRVLPGAVTQAHHGVLFMDEAPEFHPAVIQALRQPIESGEVVVSRAVGRHRFPCRFQLVLAANPCPCGFGWGKGVHCTCSAQRLSRYQARLKGPVLDRIDIQVFVPVPTRAALVLEPGEPSATVAARVAEARERQADRWAGTSWRLNGQAPGPVLRGGRFRLARHATGSIDGAFDRGQLTMRGYDRCLRLAWTLSDLAGTERPDGDDIGRALALRQPDVRVAA